MIDESAGVDIISPERQLPSMAEQSLDPHEIARQSISQIGDSEMQDEGTGYSSSFYYEKV